jgi:hypothetical protein
MSSMSSLKSWLNCCVAEHNSLSMRYYIFGTVGLVCLPSEELDVFGRMPEAGVQPQLTEGEKTEAVR